MKKDDKKTDFEYVLKELPEEWKNCSFGDEYFFFDGKEGNPKYENINEKWDEFVQWIEGIRQKNMEKEGFADSYPDRVGQEVARWARKHDVYPIYLIIEYQWEIFRDTYLLAEGCPEIVLEFIRGILYGKRTEEQLWGPPETRAMKGKIIIFDKKYLPKEGEDTGGLEIEYQPVKCPPEYAEMEHEPCPIPFKPLENVLFLREPLFMER